MMTDTDEIDNLLAQRRELMDKIEEQIDERGRIIERIQSAPDTPIARLRELHRPWTSSEKQTYCQACQLGYAKWPCDTIAALDALEEGIESARRHMYALNKAVADERDKTRSLQARIDAATVLIREAMFERHRTSHFGPFSGRPCGSPLSTSIDTCPNCATYRAWLGDKEEHSGQ